MDDVKLSKDVLDWFCIHEGLKEQRYLHSQESIHKSNWATSILSNLSDSQFRTAVRMDCHSFCHVLQMIQDDLVFHNNSNNLQDPIASQLHYALYNLGHDGSAVGYIEAAFKWGISEGHIYNTTSCVVEAL